MVSTRSMTRAKAGSFRAKIQEEFTSSLKARAACKPKPPEQPKKTYNLRPRGPHTAVVPAEAVTHQPSSVPVLSLVPVQMSRGRKRQISDEIEPATETVAVVSKKQKTTALSSKKRKRSDCDGEIEAPAKKMRDVRIVATFASSSSTEYTTSVVYEGINEETGLLEDWSVDQVAVIKPSQWTSYTPNSTRRATASAPKKRKGKSAASKSAPKRQKAAREAVPVEQSIEVRTATPEAVQQESGDAASAADKLPEEEEIIYIKPEEIDDELVDELAESVTEASADKGKQRAVTDEPPVIYTAGAWRDASPSSRPAAFNTYRNRNQEEEEDDDDDDESDNDYRSNRWDRRAFHDDEEYDPFFPSTSYVPPASTSTAVPSEAHNDAQVPSEVNVDAQANVEEAPVAERSIVTRAKPRRKTVAPKKTRSKSSGGSIAVFKQFGDLASTQFMASEGYVPFRPKSRKEQALMSQMEKYTYEKERWIYNLMKKSEATLTQEVQRRASRGEGPSGITSYTVATGSFAN